MSISSFVQLRQRGFLSLVLVSLLVSACSALAQTPSSPLSSVPIQKGVKLPRYENPRIGDLAPELVLSQVDGTLWNSRDELGQRTMVLVMFGASPVLIGKNLTPHKVLSEIARVAIQLKERGVTVVAISQTQGISLKGLDAGFDALTLRDDSGALAKAFNISPTATTLVSIDRAGFLRNVETVIDPATVSTHLSLQNDPTPAMQEGQVAPDFALSDMRGQVRRLSELRSRKNLLLTFFPKCFTGGCANHLSSLQENLSALQATDTEVWAVSIDPAAGERGQIAFAENLGLNFPLLPDEGRNLSLLFGAARKPYSTPWRRTYLIDKNGVLRFVDKGINVFTHGAEVLAKLRELGLDKAN